jgi:hypothetical protein
VLDESPFRQLPEDLLVELLTERVSHAEAGSGCVFDILASSLYKNPLIGLKVIMRALKDQKL